MELLQSTTPTTSHPPLCILPKMPRPREGSRLTNQVFWSAVAFLGNFVAFILVRESEFFIDQFGSEEQKWQVSTLLVSAEFIVPALLFCNFLWGRQIRSKSHKSLFLNVALTYLAFLVLAVAAHLGEYPKFHIEVEEKEHNYKKIRNLYTAGAFAISSLGLSRAMKLQFEIGVFSFCIAYAMEVSLGILTENGRRRNWFYIVGTATFCFLLILIRKYLDGLLEKQATVADANGPDQMGSQPPNNSVVNDSMRMDMVEAGLQRRFAHQAKDGSSTNGNSDSNTGEPGHRRVSSVNDEGEESWSVDEEYWESIPPKGDADASSSDSDGDSDEDSEDTPFPLSPPIANIGTSSDRNLDQCYQADQVSSSTSDFEDTQANVNIGSISEVGSIDQVSSFVGDSDSNPLPAIPETLTLPQSFQGMMDTGAPTSRVEQGQESSSPEDVEYTPRSLPQVVNIGASGSVNQSHSDQNAETRHQGKDVREAYTDATKSILNDRSARLKRQISLTSQTRGQIKRKIFSSLIKLGGHAISKINKTESSFNRSKQSSCTPISERHP